MEERRQRKRNDRGGAHSSFPSPAHFRIWFAVCRLLILLGTLTGGLPSLAQTSWLPRG